MTTWSQILEIPISSIVIGKISSSFGVLGSFKIYVDKHGDALLKSKTWYFEHHNKFYKIAIKNARRQGQYIIADSDFFTNPEDVEKYKHANVYVCREEFPNLQKDEYYWVDLIDKNVINKNGAVLGIVKNLLESPANDILSIETIAGQPVHQHLLIPFLNNYVIKVEGDNIFVDWELETQ